MRTRDPERCSRLDTRGASLLLMMVMLASFMFAVVPAPASAATQGSVTPRLRLAAWRGAHVTKASIGGPGSCGRDRCDRFAFSLKISEDYWRSRNGGVRIWIRWIERNDDFDLYVYRRSTLLGSSRDRASTSESVFLGELRPGTYRALVVPVKVTDANYGGFASLRVSTRQPRGDTFRVPTRIASDCSRDVTSRLLAWIASVPDNSVLSFGRRACYRIDQSLRINDRWGLVFDGNGSTFRAFTEGDGTRRHFWFFGGGDLTIRDLTVRGANPHAGLADEAYRVDLEAQHALALQGVQRAMLNNIRAFDVFGDFVYIGPDVRVEGAQIWSRDITIQNSWFERNGRQGIGIGAVERATIRWNYLGEMRRATFDMEPTGPSWGARDVHIFNNVTGRGRLLWFADKGAGFNVSRIIIESNFALFVVAVPVVAVLTPEGGLRGPFYVRGNNFLATGSERGGFEFHRATGAYVSNNRVAFPPGRAMVAVRLVESNTVRVTDNTLKGAAQVIGADLTSFDYLEANNTT